MKKRNSNIASFSGRGLKRLAGSLLSVLTAFTMCVPFQLTVHAESYDLWVNGVQVTSDNSSRILDSLPAAGNVSFDAQANVLTLENADLTQYAADQKGIIDSELSSLTIALKGQNSITVPAADINGIYTPGSLTITNSTDAADASLTITVSSADTSHGMGINAGTSAVFSGGITAISGPEGSLFASSDTVSYSGNEKITAGAINGTNVTIGPAYTITYDLNGGTGTIDAQNVSIGSDAVIPDTIPASPAGSYFMGWAADSAAVEGTYQAGGTIPAASLTGDLTLYAIYGSQITLPIETVTGGTYTITPGSVNPGGSITAAAQPASGYQFLRWERSEDSGASYQAAGTDASAAFDAITNATRIRPVFELSPDTPGMLSAQNDPGLDNAEIVSVDNSGNIAKMGVYQNGTYQSGIAFQLKKDASTKTYSNPAVEIAGAAVMLITQIQDDTQNTLIPTAYRLAEGDWVNITDPSALYSAGEKAYDLSSLIGNSYLTGLRLNPKTWNETAAAAAAATDFSVGFNDLIKGSAGFDAAVPDITSLPTFLSYTISFTDGGTRTAKGTDTGTPKSSTLQTFTTYLMMETGSNITPKSQIQNCGDTMDFPVQSSPAGTNYAQTEIASVITVDGSVAFKNPYYESISPGYIDTKTPSQNFNPPFGLTGYSQDSSSVQYFGYMKNLSVQFDTDTAENRAVLALTKGVSLTSGLSRVGGNYYLSNTYHAKIYYTTNLLSDWTLANPDGTVNLLRNSDRGVVYFTLAEGEYVTGVRVVPDDNFYAYGGNELSAGQTAAASSAAIQPYELPDIGLLTRGATPAVTPVKADRAELGVFQGGQRLAYSGTFSYQDATGATQSSTFSGNSSRLSARTVYIGTFSSAVSYQSFTNQKYLVYQGGKTTATVTQSYTFNVNGFNAASDLPNAAIRPTLYFKIAKEYTVSDVSALAAKYNAKASFTANHFSDGDGLLIIQYTGASNEIKPGTDFTTEIPLTVLPTAAPQDEPGKPAIVQSWIDTLYDQGSEAAALHGYIIRCSGSVKNTYTDSATLLQSNAAEVLLTVTQTEKSRILAFSEFGVSVYGTADQGTYASGVSNTDRDQDHIFGMQTVLNTPVSENTKDWYFYIQVPTDGRSAKYYDTAAGAVQDSAQSGFSVYPSADFTVYSGNDGSSAISDAKTYYTTAASPSMNGLSGNANGTDWKTYEQLTDTEKKQVTYICVYVPAIASSSKVSYYIPYKLAARKAAVGTISAYSTVRFNFKDSTSGALQLSSEPKQNNVTSLVTYTLKDLEISGRAWTDTNRNSLYDTGEAAASGTLTVADDSTQIKNADGSAYSAAVSASGGYTAAVPHTGSTWKLTFTPAANSMLADYHAARGSSGYWSDFHPAEDRTSGTTDALTVEGSGLSEVNAGIWSPFKVTYSWGSAEGTDYPTGAILPTGGEYQLHDASFKGADTSFTSSTVVKGTRNGVTGNWHFSGWSTTADTSKGIKSDVAYIGTWTFKALHSVNFEAGGGVPAPAAQSVEDGAKAVRPGTDPARTGYQFSGWTNGTAAYDFASAVTADLTLNAGWTPVDYTITYQLNGGTMAKPYPESYTIETDDFMLKAPTKTGYTFTGWTGSNGNTAQMSVAVAKGSTENRTYTANWKANHYKIIFNANGGSQPETEQDVTFDQKSTLTANAFTRSGYHFAQWGTAADGSGSIYADQAEVMNLIADPAADGTSSFKLYAQWEENANVTINYVSADAAMGTVSSDHESIAPATGEAAGSTAKANPGYHFVSWKDQSGTVVSTGSSFAPAMIEGLNVSATYTANFAPNAYTIKFDGNSGTGTMADQSLTYGVSTKLSKNGFTLTGFSFSSWNTKKDGTGTSYDDAADIAKIVLNTVSAGNEITLYAQWTVNKYKVTYANGTATGGTLPSEQSGNYGSSLTLGTNRMTKSSTAEDTYTVTFKYNGNGTADTTAASSKTLSYTANGWTTESGSETQVYADGADYTVAASDLILYPCFTQSLSGQSAVALPAPARTGYIFAGWYDAATGGNKVSETASYVPSSNISLYAHWTPISYKVHFDANGFTGSMTDETLVYDAITSLTANAFTRAGYHFAGWSTTETGTVLYTDQQAVSNLISDPKPDGSSSITLYAQWAENTDVAIDYASADAVMGTVSSAHESIASATGKTAGSTAKANPGYHFVSWTDQSGTVVSTESLFVPAKIEGLNVPAAYTANFAPFTYTIKFDGNSGTGTMTDQSLTYGVSTKLSSNSFTMTDYTFSNWNTAKDGTGTSYEDAADIAKIDLSTVSADNEITLYAQWRINPDTVEYRLEQQIGITEVPEELQNIPALDTPAKIEAEMRVTVKEADSEIPTANIEVYDVRLQFSTDDGKTWIDATKDNFPKEGITIVLPYPTGTDASYDFAITHMFTIGSKAGTTENLSYTKTAKGLQVKVMSLSPFGVGYVKKDSVPSAGSAAASAAPAAKKNDLWCITYLDCKDNTVSVQWVETGKAPVKPAGYSYPDIANVSAHQDVRPTSCRIDTKYVVPNTADKG